MEHPDERVRCALIKAGYKVSPPERYKLSSLAATAKARADREGHLWTPLLDAAHKTRYGPSRPQDYLGRLRDWVAGQSDPRQIERLFAFNNDDVHIVCARTASCMDDAYIERVLEYGGGYETAIALLGNASLSDAHLTRIEDWAAQDSAVLLNVLIHAEARRNGPLRRSIYEAVVVEPNPWVVRLKHLPEDLLLENQLSCVEADMDTWAADADTVHHPNASKDVWLAVLAGTGYESSTALRTFFMAPERRLDPDIRRALLGHRLEHKDYRLLLDDRLDDEQDVFTRFAACSPKQAMSALELYEDLRTRLGVTALTPLLSAPDGQVRQRAILLLGKMQSAIVRSPEYATGRSQGL